MAKTHHVDADRSAAATNSGNIGAVLMLRPTCGTRATTRGNVLMSSNWDEVDCARCLTRKPETQPAQTETPDTAKPVETLTARPAKRTARTTCIECHCALQRERTSGDYVHVSTQLNRCPEFAQPRKTDAPAAPAPMSTDEPDDLLIAVAALVNHDHAEPIARLIVHRRYNLQTVRVDGPNGTSCIVYHFPDDRDGLPLHVWTGPTAAIDAGARIRTRKAVATIGQAAEEIARWIPAPQPSEPTAEAPTCTTCGTENVEDDGDHADQTGHWPIAETGTAPYIDGYGVLTHRDKITGQPVTPAAPAEAIPMPDASTAADPDAWTTRNAGRNYVHAGLPGWELVQLSPRRVHIFGPVDGIPSKIGHALNLAAACRTVAYCTGAPA